MVTTTLAEGRQLLRQRRIQQALQSFLKSINAIAQLSTPLSIFISYAWPKLAAERDIQSFLVKLHTDLQMAGIKVQLDLFNLKPGVDIQNYMQKGIESCSHVLMVGTNTYQQRAKQKTNVAVEVGHIEAKRQKKAESILPLLYAGEKDTAFPQGYSFEDPFDYRQELEIYYEKLPILCTQLLGASTALEEACKQYNEALADINVKLTDKEVTQFIAEEAEQLQQAQLTAQTAVHELVHSIYEHHPDYQTYPDIWSVPAQTALFINRINEQKLVSEHLFSGPSGSTTQYQVVAGKKGAGKTEFCKAFAYENGSRYSDLVWWIDGSSEATFAASYRQLAQRLQLNIQEKSTQQVIQLVNDWLENPLHTNWLLVVDNATQSILSKLPQKNGCVLLASSEMQWPKPTIELAEFKREEAVNLIQKLSKDNDSIYADNVAALLEDWPSKISGAGNYLRENRLTLKQYYDFSQQGEDLVSRGINPDYDAEQQSKIASVPVDSNASTVTINGETLPLYNLLEAKSLLRERLATKYLQRFLALIKAAGPKTTKIPQVFISYAMPKMQEEREVYLFILKISEHLRQSGVAVRFDLFDLTADMLPHEYKQKSIEEGSHVLMIGTPTYLQHIQEGTPSEETLINTKRSGLGQQDSVVPIWYAGDFATVFPPNYINVLGADYRPFQAKYYVDIATLVMRLYGWYGEQAAPEELQREWEAYQNELTQIELGLTDEAAQQLLREEARQLRDEKVQKEAYVGQRLDKIAQDHPQYITYPQIWQVPNRNNDFVGREELLTCLSEQLILVNPKEPIRYCVLSGMPGAGKSQIANAFVHRHGTRYHKVVWWINAETEASFYKSYHDLAEQLKLNIENKNEEEIVQLVNQWLERPENANWLMVLDNAENPKWIIPKLPQRGGSVLITSRRDDWKNLPILSIGTMSREESKQLLTRLSGSEESIAVNEVAELLGDLPLELAHAAYHIRAEQSSFDNYAKAIRQSQSTLLAQGAGKITHLQNVEITLEMSIKAVEKQNPRAIEWLKLMSFFAPDDIPYDLLREWVRQQEPTLNGILFDEACGGIIAILVRYGLIQENKSGMNIHRLVQEVIRQQLLQVEQYTTYLDQTAAVAERQVDFKEEKPSTWPKSWQLTPHILRVAEYLKIAKHALEKAITLFQTAGNIQQTYAQYATALTNFTQALELAQTVYGDEHEAVINHISNVGNALFELGSLQQALERFEDALRVSRLRHGDEHEQIAMNQTYAGNVLRELGQIDKALQYQKKSRRMISRLLGDTSPQLAIALDNLGATLLKLGDAEQALLIIMEALFIIKLTYDYEHPQIAMLISTLGDVALSHRDKQGALGYYESALEIRRQLHGNKHAQFAIVLNKIGLVLCDLRQPQNAIERIDEALEINMTIYGKDHIITALTLANKAVALYGVGNYEESRRFAEDALNITQQYYAEDHPEVIKQIKYLGMTLIALNEKPGALQYYEDAIRRTRMAQDKNSYGLVELYNEITIVMIAFEDFGNAIKYYQLALEEEQRIEGGFDAEIAADQRKLKSIHFLPDSSLTPTDADYLRQALIQQQGRIHESKMQSHAPTFDDLQDMLVDIPAAQGPAGVLGFLTQLVTDPSQAATLFATQEPAQVDDSNPEFVAIQDTMQAVRSDYLQRLQGLLSGAGEPTQQQPSHQSKPTATADSLKQQALLLQAQLSQLKESVPNDALQDELAEIRQRLALAEQNEGPEHPAVLSALKSLVLILLETKQFDEAQHTSERALSLSIKLHTDHHSETANVYILQGRLMLATNKFAKAREIFERAFVIFQQTADNEHQNTKVAKSYLRQLYGFAHFPDPAIPQDDPELKTLQGLQAKLRVCRLIFGENNSRVRQCLSDLEKAMAQSNQPEIELILSLPELLTTTDDKLFVTIKNDLEDVTQFERIMGTLKSTEGVEPAKLAADWNILGNIAATINNRSGSVHCYKRALENSYQAFGRNNASVSLFLVNIAISLGMLDKYPVAVRCFKESIAIARQVFEKNDLKIAMRLQYLGVAYAETEQHQLAAECYEEAFGIFRANYEGAHEKTVGVLYGLVTSLCAIDEFAKAKLYLQDLIDFTREVYGDESIDLATAFARAYLIAFSLGNMPDAINYARAELAIRRNDTESTIFTTLNNLGCALYAYGDNEAAVACFQEALLNIPPDSSDDKTDMAIVMTDLGRAQVASKQIPAGLEQIDKAQPHLANKLANILNDIYRAETYMASLQYELALPIAEKAFEDAKYSPGSGKLPLYTLQAAICLTQAYRGMQSWSKVEEPLSEAVKLAQQGPEFHPDKGRVFYLQGCLYLYQEKKDEARSCFEQALHIFQKQLIKDHPETIQVETQLRFLAVVPQSTVVDVPDAGKIPSAADIARHSRVFASPQEDVELGPVSRTDVGNSEISNTNKKSRKNGCCTLL